MITVITIKKISVNIIYFSCRGRESIYINFEILSLDDWRFNKAIESNRKHKRRKKDRFQRTQIWNSICNTLVKELILR